MIVMKWEEVVVANVRHYPGKIPSSGMWLRVTVVRTEVSEERITSIIKVERIDEPGTTLAVTSN
jgi:hypothetical protein